MIKTEQDKKKTNLMIEYCKDSYQISQKACRKISDRDGADGFFIICHMPRYDIEKLPLKDDMLVMVLDGLEQPGNVGATIRSLDAAGGDFAIMTNRRVRLTHSRVIRASLGAAFMMPVCVCDMAEVVKWLVKNKFKIIVTDLTAKKSYYDIDYSGRVCIVAGNEYLGISPDWRHVEGAILYHPMLGSVESLNVGFASTIVAYRRGDTKASLTSYFLLNTFLNFSLWRPIWFPFCFYADCSVSVTTFPQQLLQHFFFFDFINRRYQLFCFNSLLI